MAHIGTTACYTLRMPSPSSSARPAVSAFTRARPRGRIARVALVGACAALAAAWGGTAAVDPAAHGAQGTPRPVAQVPALGTRWFALGASLPWFQRGCDFGCGAGRGVRGTSDRLDPILRSMSRRGVRVVRWELFPSEAWQVRRGADGTPTSLAPGVAQDLDAALRLAARHDLYLLPVLFPDADRIPGTWFTEERQSAALAAALRPMFARYRTNRHLLGWEVATRAERLEDSGAASREQLRRQARHLLRVLEQAAPDRLAFIAPSGVDRIDGWTGLGADAYLPHDPAGTKGEACASCRTAAGVRNAEGADAPIAIGAFDVATEAAGRARLDAYVRQGYAGALAWSWRGIGPADDGQRVAHMPDDATWRLHHAEPSTGPRRRPLNACYGPDAGQLRCPNLVMSRPSSVRLGRRGSRAILYSTNSLDSVGDGPASLHGIRDGRFTMSAHQLLHRRSGSALRVPTGARLLFKAIPGQYRYWKWNGAAQMELWRLDAAGTPVQRTRVGPKTVYCLRDLRRTKGWLDRSPASRVYPACSQRLSQRSVTLGTSVGWSDVYPASYHENWIDVTGLRGCFAYVHVADPTNVIHESDEDDNASHVVVRLPYTGSSRGCPGARPIPTATGDGGY